MEKEGNTQRDRMKEQGRAKDIFPLLVHSGNGCNVWQGETKKCLEFYLGLPHGWQQTKHLDHLLLLFQYNIKKMD